MVENTFAEAVKAEIERRGFEVIIAPVLKNNGLTLTGITIRTEQAYPTLYLDSIPEEHRNPFMVPRIVDEIIETMERFKGTADSVGEIKDLMEDRDALMKRIMPRLVNYNWNAELLETLPHRHFLDLAITYDIDVGENASCRVSNQMLKSIDLTEADLCTAALKNANSQGYSIRQLSNIVKDAVITEFPSFVAEPLPDMPMIVVTNKSGINGAYALLDEELMAEIGGDFYILPSSMHELIVIPVDGAESVTVSDLKELVVAVNKENVPVEERLSDNVYLYSDGAVRIAE